MSLSNPARLFSLSLAALVAGCLAPSDSDPAEESIGRHESGLTAVPSFGTNPGNLKMFTYIPAGVPANAPVVVAMHGCAQTAPEYVKAGWNALADQWKFYVVYPEQQTGNHPMRCFNWYTLGDLQRDAGEPLSIKQMVDTMKSQYSVDPARVFVTGLSAGGAMTSAMLAAYPDVFSGGAVMAGLPYKCATSAGQSGSCMTPGVDRTPAAWGDLVRAAAPGHAGPRPRVSIWHGASDYTVNNLNMRELVDQWTNVHGIDTTADATTTVSGATRSEYRNASGETLVESYLIPGMGHGTAVDPGFAPAGGCGTTGGFVLDANICSTYHAGLFFGLDNGAGGSSASSSTSASSSSASSSSASSSGASSSSASSSSSGSGGSGGAGGAGGAPGEACEDFYDANYYHVVEGRAVRCGIGGSYVCAIGSNQQIGLYTMMQTWLRRTAPDYYEAGQCP